MGQSARKVAGKPKKKNVEDAARDRDRDRDTWPAPPPVSGAVPIAHDTIRTPPPDAHQEYEEPMIPALRSLDLEEPAKD